MSKPQIGYVYLAQLIEVHPLYPAARRLSQRVALERLGEYAPVASAAAAPWDPPLLVGVMPEGFPYGEVRSLWQRWEGTLRTPPARVPGMLPADLEATRRWHYREIEAAQAVKLAIRQAEESRRLARLREQLVRERLVELANLGLRFDRTPEEIEQQVREGREAIWAEVRSRLEEEELVSTAVIARYEEGLRAEEQSRKAAVDAELEREAAARREQVLPPVLESYAEMRQRMERAVGRVGISGRAAEVLGDEPGAQLLAESQQTEEHAAQAYVEAQRRQAERIVEARSELLKAILRDTRRGVARVAFEQNLRISLVPPGRVAGRNLTGQVRGRLNEIWSRDSSLRRSNGEEPW